MVEALIARVYLIAVALVGLSGCDDEYGENEQTDGVVETIALIFYKDVPYEKRF